MRILRLVFGFFLLLTNLQLSAQKTPMLNTDADIITKAQEFLTSQQEQLKLEAEKLGIHGDFTFDITLHKKGNVLTIFSPFEIKDELIRSQNQLKDLLMKFQFPFKLPKDKRVKFRHNFNFR